MSIPSVKAFFDRPTGSLQYVFHDPASLSGAIVDPVWNFYPEGAAVTTESADEILDYVQGSGIKIEWILDTHPHADHFSAAPYLAGKLKAPCAIGEKVTEVQKLWRRLYHLPADFPIDGRQWDRLFADGDTFVVGSIPVRVMFSPGHTPPDWDPELRWVRWPLLNTETRLAMMAEPANGRLVVRGYESGAPATQILMLPASG